MLDFRNLWNPNEPSVADIDKIERKIKKLPKGMILRLGGMTDCFQPIESKYKVTYNTIKLLNKYGIGYLIVTKSNLIASDEYIKILDKRLAHIQITVTTTDDKFSLKYEKATIPSKRIEAIEKLQKLGFDVQVRLSPFIEEFIDFDILNNIKCDKILVEFLRVNSWIKRWFNIDYSKYTLKQSGYSHLQLKDKIKMLKKIKNYKEMTICEDVTNHYLYWKKNINVNKDDCCNLRKV